MIKTILVPTDGSEHAKKAVTLAADIAAKYGAHLVLFHVMSAESPSEDQLRMARAEHITTGGSKASVPPVPEGRFPASTIFGQGDDKLEVRQFLAESILAEAKRSARDQGAEDVRCVIEDGDPVKQILKYAEAQSANLIVMGCRGLSDLKGLLMGSVSHKISQLSPCSCVTVK